jgi:beta-phosphoglucomutase family hydrolase
MVRANLTHCDAVIFDLDGVITQTATTHGQAWKAVFDEFLEKRIAQGEKPFAPFDLRVDYPRFIDGKPRYDGVRSFLASRNITLPEGRPTDPPGYDTVTALGNRKNEIFADLVEEHGVEVFQDTVEQVRYWRGQGVKTAVVSSSKNCLEILRATGLEDLFEVRIDGVVAVELGLPGKPAPDTFLEAARQLGVDPANAAVVEDADAGVQAGRRGRFGAVIGMAREEDRVEPLRQAGADLVVRSLREVELPA